MQSGELYHTTIDLTASNKVDLTSDNQLAGQVQECHKNAHCSSKSTNKITSHRNRQVRKHPYSSEKNIHSKNCTLCDKRLIIDSFSPIQSFTTLDCSHRICKPCISLVTYMAQRKEAPVTCPECNAEQSDASIAIYQTYELPVEVKELTSQVAEQAKNVQGNIENEASNDTTGNKNICPVCHISMEINGPISSTSWIFTNCNNYTHYICQPCFVTWNTKRLKNNQPVNCPYCAINQPEKEAAYFRGLCGFSSSVKEVPAQTEAKTVAANNFSSTIVDSLKTASFAYFAGHYAERHLGRLGLFATGGYYLARLLFLKYKSTTQRTA